MGGMESSERKKRKKHTLTPSPVSERPLASRKALSLARASAPMKLSTGSQVQSWGGGGGVTGVD